MHQYHTIYASLVKLRPVVTYILSSKASASKTLPAPDMLGTMSTLGSGGVKTLMINKKKSVWLIY